MSFVQFKIFYGDNFERCKMHRMKKERFQLITYQETIDYQLECMLLPLQFKLYMLELRGRSWTSRQSDDVFHQRHENSLVTGILVVSGCLTAFRFSCKNTCRDMYFVVSAVVLCCWKWSCFRGAGETHRRFAGSFTIVLSVLTCTAWTGVAVACTLTDSLWFPDK